MPQKFEFYAVKLAVIATVVYFVSLAFPEIVTNFSLVSSDVFARPWIIITHMFLHGSLLHLGYNMFALLLFGSILEKHVGSKRFLIIFFAAGVVSSIGDVLFYPVTLGASGAIFGILGALAVLRPKMVVWVIGVPMYMFIAVIIWALLDLAGFFYPDGIAHAAHLFGMGFGIVLGLWLRPDYKHEKSKQKKKQYIISDKELDAWEEKYMKRR